jgi:hypothetical protein
MVRIRSCSLFLLIWFFLFVESKCHLVGLKSPQICLPVGDFWAHLIISLGCISLNIVDAAVSVLGN